MAERGSDSYEGTWHIPEFNLSPVGGIYTPLAKTNLRVFGELWPTNIYGLSYRTGELPPILGTSSGRAVTLLSPQSAGSTRHGDIVSETRVYSPTALIGAHFKDSVDAKFNSAVVELTGTLVLVDSPDFIDGGESDSHSIGYNRQVPQSASVDGASIELLDWFTGKNNLWLRELRRAPYYRISFDEPASVDEIEYTFVRPLRYLTSLATNRPCSIVSFNVDHPDVKYEGVDRLRPITVRRSDERSVADYLSEPGADQIFRVFDLSQYSFPDLVEKWFQLMSDLGAVADLIFSTDNSRGYVENQFFDLASALEGLCRYLRIPSRRPTNAEQDAFRRKVVNEAPEELKEWVDRRLRSSENPTMEDKVNAILKYCGIWTEEYVGRSGAWSRTVARFRNGVAHPLGGQTDVFTEHRLTGRLVANLNVILRISLLRLVGFSSDQCESLLRNALYWDASFNRSPQDFPDVYT